jgi:ABC-type branched-subunit amino acid transport system substrate-binding protein
MTPPRKAVAAILMVALAGCGSTVATEPVPGAAAGPAAIADGLALDSGGAAGQGELGGAVTGTAPGVVGSEAGSLPGASSTGSTGGTAAAPVPAPGAGAPASAGRAAAPAAGGTIRLGFPVLKNGNVLLSGFGTSVSFGDGRRQVEAIVGDWNKRGGIAGRRIVAAFAEVDVAATDTEANYLAACNKLTQDDKVFAVLTPINPPESFLRCVARSRTLILNASFAPTDDVLQRELRDWLFSPTLLNLNRGERLLLEELRAAGKLGKNARVGLLVNEKNAPNVRVADTVIKPMLKSWGVPVTAQTISSHTDTSGVSNAALRFRSDGVNLVVFVSPNGLAQLQFMQAAENQGYRPGYGVTDYDSTKFLAESAPRSQMENASGIGSLPISNVPASEYPSNDQEKACLAVMREAGMQAGSRYDNVTATLYCELVQSFAAPASLVSGALDAAAWRNAYGRVSGYRPLSTFAVDFGNGRTDNAGAYRSLSWKPACGCMTYTGNLRPVP